MVEPEARVLGGPPGQRGWITASADVENLAERVADTRHEVVIEPSHGSLEEAVVVNRAELVDEQV